MRSLPRRVLHRFIPAQFHDPVGLTKRLIKSHDPAAFFAMRLAAAGPVCAPLDFLLEPFERRAYQSAPPRRLPVILVCGPPRSGTTLLLQALIQNLPVAYFDNLTALFPRSPITANRLFSRFISRSPMGFRSYYGRTEHLSGSNDGLQLWDRWLGADRSHAPSELSPEQREAMVRFFNAFEAWSGRALVAKNNNLNASASLVAEALPDSYFLCLAREPVFLARSLLRARMEIHGREDLGYGLSPENTRDDPVEDVCHQVLFHSKLALEQKARIGAARFQLVSYEGFCRNPGATLKFVTEEILRRPVPSRGFPNLPEAFEPANTPFGNEALLARLEHALGAWHDSSPANPTGTAP
ncbi:MAG TPA: sulfotransferase [Gemmatimonadales bacterium]|nr:sulfotransferase [Gemmatimonadales bacterium]